MKGPILPAPDPATAEPVNRINRKTGEPEQWVSWEDAGGKRRTAKSLPAGEQVLITSEIYTAKYRDGSGRVRKVSTGCRQADNARAKLVELENRAEAIRSNRVTAAEDSITDHQATPIGQHVDAYIDHLRGKRGKGAKAKVSPVHVANVKRSLNVIIAGCGFKRLRDIDRNAVERWLHRCTEKTKAPSPRTLNSRMVALTAFGNWCVQTGRLLANPLARPPKLDESIDCRRKRRALTENELRRLMKVARLRPLAEYGRAVEKLPPGEQEGRKTWKRAPLDFATIDDAVDRARAVKSLAERPEFVAELERRGEERALMYKALVLTGLRKGELAALKVGDLDLDGHHPHATLSASDSKAGQAATIPLRHDLAADLGHLVAQRLEDARRQATASSEPIPSRLPSDAPVFRVPSGLVRILDRDLAAAGIPKRDERGRTIDVHAMRHKFGSHLSRGGVAPRTAQAALRHSSIDLTMNVYTDPRLLDVHGALDALPSLPLDDGKDLERAKATGTFNAHPDLERGPMRGPKIGRDWHEPSRTGEATEIRCSDEADLSGDDVNGNAQLAQHVKRSRQDSNLQPLAPEASALSN